MHTWQQRAEERKEKVLWDHVKVNLLGALLYKKKEVNSSDTRHRDTHSQ